jgi:L,D-transpeptidase YcbB
MNITRVVLCWSVAMCFGLLSPIYAMMDDRDSTAAVQSSPLETLVSPAIISSPEELVAAQIRIRIETAGVVTELRAGGEPVYASSELPEFYIQRLYQPAWSDSNGPIRLVDDLVNSIRGADLEGLRPEDYHLTAIEILLSAVRDDLLSGAEILPDRWAELDLLLTDAFMEYGSHLLAGRVNPETIKPEWVANRRGADFASLLKFALALGDVAGTLEKLALPQRGFQRLREALAHYRALAAEGGWPTIPDGPTLKLGDKSLSVIALKERLLIEGDMEITEREDPELFDESIELALKRFQKRHGLTDDGEMGDKTRAQLNVSVEHRVEQLELNLERWRWLPQDMGQRHIIVNIAAFQLKVVEDNAGVMAMRVVVGLPYHHTPVFSDIIRYLVLNPYWHVPRSIAVNDILPKVKNDPSYLTKQKLKVFQGVGSETREIDISAVDWSNINSSDFPFVLRQEPGPINALGRIKFMFPNKFNVYLHDTPTQPLFEETQRDFSHGCIRIQKPFELALYLLQQDPLWNRETLQLVLTQAVDRSITLPEPIPVHLLYWTAWADEDGTIQFREDIYDQDAPLLKALREPLLTKE